MLQCNDTKHSSAPCVIPPQWLILLATYTAGRLCTRLEALGSPLARAGARLLVPRVALLGVRVGRVALAVVERPVLFLCALGCPWARKLFNCFQLFGLARDGSVIWCNLGNRYYYYRYCPSGNKHVLSYRS